jgi:hypothetical protein
MRLISLIFISLLSACAQRAVCVDSCDMPKLNLTNPEKLALDRISIQIESDKDSSPHIKISMEDYKKMSVNLHKILFYIKTQNKIINAYRNYYEDKDGQIKNK